MHLITDEQRTYLASLSLKERQKEILKDEYRNGEWYCSDIRTARADELPRSDCWCFGSPCTSFSQAGLRNGLDGESGLILEVFRLLGETPEEDRPEWLFYENVKGMFSSNKGLDFLAVLSEMVSLGYDPEWQLINSKYFVPQNRERVYTIGHLRDKGSSKIFPLEGTDGEDCLEVKQIGMWNGKRKNLNQYRVYDPSGIAPTLTKSEGGGRQPMIGIKVIGNTRKPVGYGADRERVLGVDGITPTIRSSDYKEPYKVGIPLGVIHRKGKPIPVEPLDVVPTLTSGHRYHQPEVVIPVDVSNEDHSGTYIELEDGIKAYAIWNEREQCYIVVRRLTPREYWRLQSFPDEMFDRAQFVNSDNQLYRQAGNSVTVNIIYEIAKKMKGEK